MNNIKSEGTCLYCKAIYADNKISRHLNSHLSSNKKTSLSNKKSFHLKITCEWYFLHLLISEDLILYDLDDYLRDIWLECCEHLSTFELKRKNKEEIWSVEIDQYEIDMETKIGDFFSKGLELIYQYDFGSTTKLEIKVLNEYLIEDSSEIILLSRNEPLKFVCSTCKKKPAQVMCLEWHTNGSMFCNSCKKEHAKQCFDFVDFNEVDIVNSPRMGVCGYEGGIIDTERDGKWLG